MSIRGFITQGAKGKEMVAETASFLPPAWLLLLDKTRLNQCIKERCITLEKSKCIKNYISRCGIIYKAFPKLKISTSENDPLVAKLSSSKAKEVHVNLEQFFHYKEHKDGAKLAWKAIDSGDTEFQHVIPGRTVSIPTIGDLVFDEVVLGSARETILFGCSIAEKKLRRASTETLKEYCFGHIWV